jgi:hypothetical protein
VSVPCIYPDALDDEGFPASLPEGFEEFKTSEYCTHLHCAEAADAYATWRAYGRAMQESEALLRADGVDVDDPDALRRFTR